jgi:uncharacterized lipoprotein YddW (UPF0748 family)
MKPIVFLVAAMLLLQACSPSTPQTDDRLREMRGVWLTNVDSEVLFDKESIVEAMDYLADRGFNLIFPVVWNKGYTLYPSQVMADYFGEEYRIDPLFARQGRDPLAELIVEAHRRGMEVMPWFEFGFASSFEENGGHLIAMKPHWAARDSSGALLKKNGFEWMNAIHPEVQDFMLALIREVIENYDVDGVQGDDRLPAMPSEGGYSEFTAALYEQETGMAPPPFSREPEFLQWKSDKLSDFGGRLFRLIKDYDPELIVSLSPSVYDWSKLEYLQDSPEWIRRGQVDILHPQAYRYEIERYLTTVDDVAMYSGYMPLPDSSFYVDRNNVLVSPGVLIKSGPRYNGPEYVLEALRYHRELGLHGEIYFFYEGLHHANQYLADSLYKYFYHEPAVQPYRQNPDWRFPGLILDAAAREVTVPQSATYSVLVHLPFGSGYEGPASVQLRVNGTERRLSHSLFSAGGGWSRLASVSLNSGDTVLFSESGGLTADRIMLLVDRRRDSR